MMCRVLQGVEYVSVLHWVAAMRFKTVPLTVLVLAGLSAAHEPPAAANDQEPKHKGCAKRQVAALSAISAMSSSVRRTSGSYGHPADLQLAFTGMQLSWCHPYQYLLFV